MPGLPTANRPRASLLGTAAVLAACAVTAGPLPAQAGTGYQTKWVRDSEAYATLTRMVYRLAASSALASAAELEPGSAWAVVLDVDETTLDNSTYELERATYDQRFDLTSWNAWVARREAGAVPGVATFLAQIRQAGGRVAFVTNREESTREDTRANLIAHDLWVDGDLLCLRIDRSYTKKIRRGEIASGVGRCAWPGSTVTVVAYLGDNMGDFPGPDETQTGGSGEEEFGRRFFILPNPMYGPWTDSVTVRRASRP